MPNVHQFLKGFNIHKKLILDDFQLIDINITHEPIIRYREYKYEITLHFRYLGNKITNLENLIQALKSYAEGERIIYTSYGNPYKCTFGNPEVVQWDSENVIIKSLGHATRIFLK